MSQDDGDGGMSQHGVTGDVTGWHDRGMSQDDGVEGMSQDGVTRECHRMA